LKLYLAGPDVFLPDAVAIGRIKVDLCRKYGFVGLYPLDNAISPGQGISLSQAIFDGNIAMLNEADAVVANLTPFRGVSADAGTVFEVGHAYACGKRIYGYSNVRASFTERIEHFIAGAFTRGKDGRRYAADGLAVEDFDRFDNLMIAEALLASGQNVFLPATAVRDVWQDMQAFEQCLQAIRSPAPASSRITAPQPAAK
jgi:nucleoside 2-deoxyribosyltransferase